MVSRALIAGLGSIGGRHLRLLRARLPDAEIMVLRHKPCGGPIEHADHCTNSLSDALSFHPEVAIIATPAPFHAELAIALAQTGTHLLIEKPMASNLQDATTLTKVAADAGVRVQIGYNLRFLPSLNEFKSALSTGKIGRVASVRAEVGQHLPDWRPNVDWRRSVSARPELGGGALLELSHEIDYLYWIFGDVKAVNSWMGSVGGLDLEVEDTAHFLLHFAAPFPPGAKGAAPVAAVTLDFIRRDTVRRCVAIGDSGTLVWDAIASQVRLIRPGEAEQILHNTQPDRDSSYRAQLEAFLGGLTTRTAPLDHRSDGIAVMRLLEALRASHAAGGSSTSPETIAP